MHIHIHIHIHEIGFPGVSDGKSVCLQCGSPEFDPGWGRSVEKEMATHSCTLAWRIPWREEPCRLLVHGVAKSQTQLSDFTHSLNS